MVPNNNSVFLLGHDIWLNKIEFETFSSKKNENGSVQAGTHLIIVDDSSCRGKTAAKSSNPKILNYYRQFLVKVLVITYLKIMETDASKVDGLISISCFRC